MLLATRLPSSLPWEPSMVKRCGRKGIRSSADSGQRLLSMPFPVVPSGLHHPGGHLPAPRSVRQRQHLPPGGAEAAGLRCPPRRVLIRGHADRRDHPGLADVDAAHPVPVQRLAGHLVRVRPSSARPRAASLRGGTARGTGGERKNLTRVLEAAMNSPLEDRIPASGYVTASTAPRL